MNMLDEEDEDDEDEEEDEEEDEDDEEDPPIYLYVKTYDLNDFEIVFITYVNNVLTSDAVIISFL